jgi:hypothetical protein
MNARKLLVPLLIALAPVGVGISSASAAAGQSPKPVHGRLKQLRIDALAVGTKTGPLTVRVAAGIESKVSMTVNGKPVRHSFEPAGPKAKQIELRSTDGLRAGRNKLRIEARLGGVDRVATRTVTVPRRALLADAGADTETGVHARARVGVAPPPGAGRAGSGLDYSWHIAARPRGAKASLVGRHTAQPHLRATKPGSYVLQLKAEPEGEGEADEAASFDQVTVSVAPNDPPIGVPINTLDSNGAISIGGQSYGANQGGSAYVVLERTTRAVVDSGTVSNDDAGIGKLLELATKYGSDATYMQYLMIVSGRFAQPTGLSPAFPALIKKLGGSPLTSEEANALEFTKPYSVIGIPGAPAGSATVRFSPDSTNPSSGAITGYLEKDHAVNADEVPVYEYVSPEQPEFDTVAAGSNATTNVMTINGKEYAGALAGGATAGLHVVVLNSLTLEPIANAVFPTNGTSNDVAAQNTVGRDLLPTVRKRGGPIVFVQTIGKPKAVSFGWMGVVETLQELGANPLLVNALNGTNEYSLVSRPGSTAPPAEASTAYDAGPYPAPNYPPAHLIGNLARSRTSNFVPNLSTIPTPANLEGGINLALPRIAYQAAQPWPELAPGADRTEADAAQKFICERLGFCQAANSCASLRECFWQRYGAEWGLKLSVLGNLAYPGDDKGFSEAIFKSEKEEFLTEIAAVANVKGYLVQLQEPLNQSALSSYVNLQGISDEVWQSVQKPEADNSPSWTLGLIGKIIALGSFAPPPASHAARGLSAVFGLASFLSDESGQPILGSQIKVRAAKLGEELVERLDLARKTTIGLGKLLVSDYGKLTAANQHVDTDWALPSNPEVASNMIKTSARQWFYEVLVPTAYPYLIRGNHYNARYLDCKSSKFRWPNQPESAQMNATAGYGPDGKPINGIFFFTSGIGGDSSPPATLGDKLFRPRSGPNPGLGLEKLQFFNPRVFNDKIAHAVEGKDGCMLGWLPRP